MKLFTLIHICRNEQSIHNNSFVANFEAQINLYFTCAKQLHRSLSKEGIELAIITNELSFLQALNKDGYQVEMIQLDFKMNVPSGIKFYSAHFKIEVFEYLSTLSHSYVGLIDADMICINPVPESLLQIAQQGIPLYYNITDQLSPAYGHSNILKDKQKLNRDNIIGLWAGGEFITGRPEFFGRLFKEISTFQSKYYSDFNSFNHQGDEMLTSVALETLMLSTCACIADAGPLSIIGRYWSPKTLHVQKPLNAFKDHFLLHLPSDKKFIAKLFIKDIDNPRFFKIYKRYLKIFHLVEATLKGIKPYVKKWRKQTSK